jgi:hypothetical protein
MARAARSMQQHQVRAPASTPQRAAGPVPAPAQPVRAAAHGLHLPIAAPEAAQRAPVARNATGLPDRLKAGVEALSGVSLDGVKVHYNSARPAQLKALAYAQGRDIHLARGQERHLPHEAWHLAQQAQGRVRPTMQMKGGVAVNDDAGLEREADAMGAKALQMPPPPAGWAPALRPPPSPGGAAAPVQALFDNLLYPNRKMGLEITEATAGPNRIEGATPSGAFAALGPLGQAALFNNVNLPNAGGAGHVWSVATHAAAGAYFAYPRGKPSWMRWGDVSMTEDTGEFEWIVHHPAAPQNMGYYRTRLNEVNTSRQAMRAALTPIGNDVIVATSPNPAGAGQAFRVQLGATNAASAQITFESVSARLTKKALFEGLSHGLNKRVRPNRETLANTTPEIITAARTSAGRFALAGADKELLIAYLYGDLMHKMATLIDGAGWGGGMDAIAKGWRNLFPKSRPYQIAFQAYGQAPTALQLAAMTAALNGARAAIVGDIVALFASKVTTTGRLAWLVAHFGGGAPDPGGHLFNTVNAAPVAAAAIVPTLPAFLAHNGLNLNTEYDNVRNGFITAPGGAFVPQVVRSHDAGFATHAPGTGGFAVEDRGEVQTTFPQLDQVYARIKQIARRF